MGLTAAPVKLLAESVSYQYPGTQRGVREFSLSVSAGEFISVAGPSGSGKSTMARCLSGLIPHLYHGTMRGEVYLGEYQTSSRPLWQLSERCGMVFQNPSNQMLGLSVEEEIIFGLENLGLGKREIDERLYHILNQFNLAELRGRTPQTLSGGEQQKLALAAIMARQPELLVLDEPLSMLDVTASSDLVADLEELSRQGTGVVIFEHRAEYLEHVPGLCTISLNGHHEEPATPRPEINVQPNFRHHGHNPELDVKNLHIQLGGKLVLEDVSFSACGGETVAVVGRNGSGKTTLLRSLVGLQKYTGEIQISGQRPDLGMVFQNADLQLFNASVREEILYRVPDPDMDLYQKILLALGLSEYEETPPLLLSEGEKKRVALATVLMHQPQHGILLDEPSLGQDDVHKQMLIRLAKMLNIAGLLVMMTTHDLVLASQADRIILLGDGKVIGEGSWAELARKPELWAQAGLHIPEWMQAEAVVC